MCEYDTATTVRQWLYTAPKFIYLLTAILTILLFANLTARDDLFDNEITVVLSDVFTSFNKNPINELTITYDSECPSGFERVKLGKWGGTDHGCACSDGTIYNHTCPNTICQWLEAVPSRELYTWNGYSFCIQRASSIRYKTNNTECPEDTTQCSLHTCVDSSEPCPLTDIRIVPIDETNYTNYDEIPVGEETRLIFSRGMYNFEDITNIHNRSEEFIVNLNVSFYSLPCMNPHKIPAPSTTSSPYPLSMIPEEGCGEYKQVQHLHEIEELPINTILVENGLNEATIERLPHFSDYISGQNAILVALKNYTVKAGTHSREIDPDVFNSLGQHEADFVEKRLYIYILTALTVALAVSLPLEGFLRYKNKEEQRIMLRLIAYLNIGALGVYFVLFIIVGTFAVNTQTDLNPIVFGLKDLRMHKAFNQEQIDEILRILINQVNDDIYIILAICVTLLFLGFVGICVLGTLTLIDIAQVRKFKITTSQVLLGGRDRRKKNKKYENTKNKGNEMLLMNQH